MGNAKPGYLRNFLTPAGASYEVTHCRPYELDAEARRRAGVTTETWSLGRDPRWPRLSLIRPPEHLRLHDHTGLHASAAIAVLVAALSSSIVQQALGGEEIPPYPYQAPPWMISLREKLKAPMSFDLNHIPLQEALEKVSTATGVGIRFANEARKAADKPISLSLDSKEQPADDILRLLLSNFGLTYKVTKEGVLVIEPSQADGALAEAEWIGSWIEHLRRQRFPTKEEKAEDKAEGKAARAQHDKAENERKERIESDKKSLRLTKVTRDFVDATLEDIVRALGHLTKVNFCIASDIQAKKRSLTVKGGRSAEKVLDEVLGLLELKQELVEDAWYITPVDRAPREPHCFFVWKEEQEAAERRILARELTHDLEGSRGWDYSKALAAVLRVKVFPDSGAWETEVTFKRKTAGLTVKQLATLLKRDGIEVVIAPSPVSYQRRSLPYSLASQRIRPPGLPDVDWSIYLLRRKK